MGRASIGQCFDLHGLQIGAARIFEFDLHVAQPHRLIIRFGIAKMELEPARGHFKPDKDDRPHMPQPPVVRLQVIEDMHLQTPAGLERDLDAFYVGLLRFERDVDDLERIAYRAERFRVVFEVVERMPEREDYRPVVCDLPDFAELLKGVEVRQIQFEWQQSIAPGMDRVLMRDPAGNFVSVGPIRVIL
jgi:hypothetical protein